MNPITWSERNRCCNYESDNPHYDNAIGLDECTCCNYYYGTEDPIDTTPYKEGAGEGFKTGSLADNLE